MSVGQLRSASVTVEWARVSPGRIVVASATRAWVVPPSGGLPGLFDGPMEGPGSTVTTRRLLDGAIAAARPERPPGVSSAPTLTATTWIWRLCGYYCTTHATPLLLREAADRFHASGRPELAAWAETKAREETGHDGLALRDLGDLGLDAARVVDAVVPPRASALVASFRAAVRHADGPVACIGYAHALERLALERRPAYIARVEALFPAGIRPTRCLRVHSATGSDAGHVDQNVALVARLPAHERAVVARACFETARIAVAPGPPPPSDVELQALVAPFRALAGARA